MERFNELLSETMEDTIIQVFGEYASDLIYRFMEGHVSLKREEVGEKFEAFYTCLEKLVGSEGTQIIHATSLKRLCLKLRREYEEVEKYFSFLDKLYEVKFQILASYLKEEPSICN